MNKLFAHLTVCDGYSRSGNVKKRNAPELERLAKAGDVTPFHLYQVAQGTRRASWLLATVLERETGGKVTVADMLPGAKPAPATKRRRTPMKT
jgi:hypothetical protein